MDLEKRNGRPPAGSEYLFAVEQDFEQKAQVAVFAETLATAHPLKERAQELAHIYYSYAPGTETLKKDLQILDRLTGGPIRRTWGILSMIARPSKAEELEERAKQLEMSVEWAEAENTEFWLNKLFAKIELECLATILDGSRQGKLDSEIEEDYLRHVARIEDQFRESIDPADFGLSSPITESYLYKQLEKRLKMLTTETIKYEHRN